MKQVKSVLAVKFKSTHSPEKLLTISHEDLEAFKNVPGLVEKYYINEEATGMLSGLYFFETKSDRAKFWASDLAKSIPPRYGMIVETLRVEEYDMLIVMNAAAMHA